MSWNYRLVNVKGEIGLYEVYYDAMTKEPCYRTDFPVRIIFDEGEDSDLVLEHVTDAFNKEVLFDAVFDGKTPF